MKIMCNQKSKHSIAIVKRVLSINTDEDCIFPLSITWLVPGKLQGDLDKKKPRVEESNYVWNVKYM